jgi:hypothetical protein
MKTKRYLKPLYPAVTVFITLIIIGANSYATDNTQRDPFRFGSVYSSQPGYDLGESNRKTVLEMILLTDRKQIAIFNGRRYQTGDFIGEYKITKIEFNKVTVKNGTDEIFFTFHTQ